MATKSNLGPEHLILFLGGSLMFCGFCVNNHGEKNAAPLQFSGSHSEGAFVIKNLKLNKRIKKEQK